MSKHLRSLLIVFAIVVIFGMGAVFLLTTDRHPPVSDTTKYIVKMESSDVAEVRVQNEYGAYTVKQGSDGITVHDLPPELVNMDYVAMLLDECSKIEYSEKISVDSEDLKQFGLDDPTASVDISFNDGGKISLFLGMNEQISGGRYFRTSESNDVYIMKNNRTIRFTMSVKNYINYVIIEPNKSTSILSAVQDITFSGSQLPQPIVLKAVLEDREDIKLLASSFGAVTHLITQPQLHEADQTELIRITESLLGLISEGVVDYNCTQEELAAYGFDNPVLQVEFDYKNGRDAQTEHHVLRLSKLEDDYIATLDDWGVVYKIAPVDFTTVSYEKLILRWFASPFITDVKRLEVTLQEDTYSFGIEGENAKNIAADLNGALLDSDLFRKYYNLIVSAAGDEKLPSTTTPQGKPVVSIRFVYKDSNKNDDLIEFYHDEIRRVLVSVNGICEFKMRDKYIETIRQATVNLAKGQSFASEW